MAVRTTITSGRASVGATFDTGVPVDGDSIVIAAGHVLQWDIDSSAWANGVAGISGAGTLGVYVPGSGDVSYPLKMKSGITNAISCLIDYGTVPQRVKWPISLLANTDYIQALGIAGRCAEPTHRYVITNDTTTTGTTEVPIDTDLTQAGDSEYWVAGADVVIGCNYNSTTLGGILAKIVSVTSTHLTIDTGVGAAQESGVYIVLLSRNVSIIGTKTSSAGIVRLMLGSTFDATLEITQVGTARQGYGIAYQSAYDSFNMPGGSIWNVNLGCDGLSFSTLSINRVLGCVIGRTSTHVNACRDFDCDGLLGIGFITGINGCHRMTLQNGFLIGASAVNSGSTIRIKPTFAIPGATTALRLTNEVDAAGPISDVDVVSYGSTVVFRGCTVSGTTGITNIVPNTAAYAKVVAYGADFSGVTNQVSNYTGDKTLLAETMFYDPQPAGGGSPQRGQLKSWTGGGTMASTAVALPADPPVAMSYAHLATCEDANCFNWITIPVFARANVQLRITVYVYIPAALPSDFTVPPTIELLTPDVGSLEAGAVLDSDVATDGTDDANGWYTLEVIHTPTYDGQFTFRVKAQDASDTFYWYPVYEGASVPTLPDVADVRDGEGYGYPETPLEGTLDLPAQTDVRFGTQYDNTTQIGSAYIPVAANVREGIDVDATVGLLDLPSINDVRFLTTYDNGSKVGLLDIPQVNDVRLGVHYDGINATGELSLPAEADVRDGVFFDDGLQEGSAAIPATSDVRFGVSVDATTGTAHIPAASDVRFGTDVDATTGTAYIPIAANVRVGIDVDATTGLIDLPIEADVRKDVQYDNATQTGTLDPAGGTTIVNSGLKTGGKL